MIWFKRVTTQLEAHAVSLRVLINENTRLTAELAAVQESNAMLMGEVRATRNQAVAAFQRCERLESRLGRLEGWVEVMAQDFTSGPPKSQAPRDAEDGSAS